ncbi:hypothetical protein AAG906_016821 [Vitis piasezkii]
MHLTKPLNKDNQTAEELFAARNERLHRDAKEWLMRTTENCTILSVFIATVAFAAAYTVPGGPNQDTGIPILNSKPFFVVFILADVFSLTLALTSCGWISSCPHFFSLIFTSTFSSPGTLHRIFQNFVAKFLQGVAIGVGIFVFVLFYCLYLAFKGLFWTVKKAFRWICGNKSDTQSPQPTAAPITQV